LCALDHSEEAEKGKAVDAVNCRARPQKRLNHANLPLERWVEDVSQPFIVVEFLREGIIAGFEV
jgi:hypothetical protein